MVMITFYVLLAGAISTAAGLLLKFTGNIAFSHFSAPDSKELAGLAGLRVSAIFAIAVGLIFSDSHAHYVEAKKNLLEEARLIGTMSAVLADTPDFPYSRSIQAKLMQYAKASAMELEQPETAERSAVTNNQILLEICKLTAADVENRATMVWLRTQLESACGKLIELRGNKRTWMLTNNVETPFWIFFCISFGSLAFLLGVFERRPLNLTLAALFYFSVGATAILIYWMSDPYHGPGRISAAPLTQLIHQIDMFNKSN
jgi:hypothetical protein